MSITDELREEASGFAMYVSTSAHAERLCAIADRIDAAHESAMYDMQREHDEWVADRDAKWVALPKDADGEYIQPSDIPYLTKANDGKRLAYYPSLELRQDGTWSLAGWTPDRYRILKPTVEDVLREFAEKVIDSQIPGVHPTYEEAIAEYAAKLRLAGYAE